jgi:hypothetical protein
MPHQTHQNQSGCVPDQTCGVPASLPTATYAKGTSRICCSLTQSLWLIAFASHPLPGFRLARSSPPSRRTVPHTLPTEPPDPQKRPAHPTPYDAPEASGTHPPLRRPLTRPNPVDAARIDARGLPEPLGRDRRAGCGMTGEKLVGVRKACAGTDFGPVGYAHQENLPEFLGLGLATTSPTK